MIWIKRLATLALLPLAVIVWAGLGIKDGWRDGFCPTWRSGLW